MSLLLGLKRVSHLSLTLKTIALNRRFICTTASLSSLNSRIRRVGSSLEKERNYALRDDIPEGYNLIYSAPMENYVAMAKNVSTVTASLIALLAGYAYASDMQFISLPLDMTATGLVSDEKDIWYFAAGFIAINVAIRLFVAKFPLRIYKKSNKYIAIYHSQWPFVSSKLHKFQQGDVREVRNVFNPWSESMYRLGNKSSLLLFDYFKTPQEFNNMFGTK